MYWMWWFLGSVDPWRRECEDPSGHQSSARGHVTKSQQRNPGRETLPPPLPLPILLSHLFALLLFLFSSSSSGCCSSLFFFTPTEAGYYWFSVLKIIIVGICAVTLGFDLNTRAASAFTAFHMNKITFEIILKKMVPTLWPLLLNIFQQ